MSDSPGTGRDSGGGVAPGAATSRPLSLDYANPKTREEQPLVDPATLRVIRRIVFAGGSAMLAYGVTCSIPRISPGDAVYWAAWGAGFVGLTVPMGRRQH